jgi:hypothetical protein
MITYVITVSRVSSILSRSYQYLRNHCLSSDYDSQL